MLLLRNNFERLDGKTGVLRNAGLSSNCIDNYKAITYIDDSARGLLDYLKMVLGIVFYSL